MVNPKIAAILNFFVWGLGYLYKGKKKLFGSGWLLAFIFFHIPMYYLGLTYFYTTTVGIITLIGHIIISILLAYDVYKN